MLTPDVSTFRGHPAPCAERLHAGRGRCVCLRLATKEVAEHLCMSQRGVEATGATTLTLFRLRTAGIQLRNTSGLDREGQARAQQLAGLALGDHERMRIAERALAGCVLDRQVTGLLTDASLCHGWAGLVRAIWRATSDALDPGPLQAALRTARRGMEDHLARAGPPASAGLLEGRSGIMLAQNDLSQAGSEPPAWDACLLLAM